MNPNTILFDMYGVIWEESKGNFLPYTYAHFESSEYDRLTKQFKVEKLFSRASSGEFDSDVFLSKLGFKDTDFHMKDYIENHLTLDGGFIPFADKYYRDYDFVLLSNDVAKWSSYITEYYKLNKYFKDKIVSGDVKCRKPDAEIFLLALQRIGQRPEQCVFIDNSVSNLKMAEKLGISTILFKRDKEEYEGTVVNSFEELEKIL